MNRKFDFRRLWREISGVINFRIAFLIFLIVCICGGLLYRLFVLQIIRGEDYMNNFRLQIRRDIRIPSTRGIIYDRNGKVLAYNELAYSVTMRDLGEGSGAKRNMQLNDSISLAIDIIEACGDTVDDNFNITIDASGNYAYTVEGRTLTRFLADIYGYANTEDLSYVESTRTAAGVIHDLCGSKYYYIGGYDEEGNFVPQLGMDPKRVLQIAAIRYRLSLNSFQKYLTTTIASDVSDLTVAAILENADRIPGIDITDDTVRRYADAKYFAHIMGYTGQISMEELQDNPSYSSGDVIGKSGLEKSCEDILRGRDGVRSVYVDNMGKELATVSTVQPTAGLNLYTTLDRDLQVAAYDILEKKLSEIILAKIRDVKEYIPEEDASSADIIIPIYDVYYAPIRNTLIDTSHFAADDASETERYVYASYNAYQEQVLELLRSQIFEIMTPYDGLTREFKNYETYIVQQLKDTGILDTGRIDTKDETYIAWTNEEVISMTEFLRYAVRAGWVNAERLSIEDAYAASDQVFDALAGHILSVVTATPGFERLLYRFMIQNDVISGTQICRILMDQGIVSVNEMERDNLIGGGESSYQFMINRIQHLDLTPAQLNLDPFSGSMVITDTSSGDVLAMVSYPSYDNNRMANRVDPVYYERLRNDLSKPLIDYCTQQKTAPGSTFKMVSSTAGLMEGVVTLNEEIYCSGEYQHLDHPKCWIHPDGHGMLNLTGGIANSCNDYFYEVGWRLATVTETVTRDNGTTAQTSRYDSDAGVARFARYAQMYGLDALSGVEIEEAAPQVSDEDSVRTAIGQGSNNYTTVGLARYVTTVATSGTCYDLTLIRKTESSDGTTVSENSARIHSILNMNGEYWDAIHTGMRQVVEGKYYFNELPVKVAGKTGTAQENENRPNHALFVCYAPYEKPQIAVATRIANGYTSDYAARITEEVLKYYFGTATVGDLMEEMAEQGNVFENITGAGD